MYLIVNAGGFTRELVLHRDGKSYHFGEIKVKSG